MGFPEYIPKEWKMNQVNIPTAGIETRISSAAKILGKRKSAAEAMGVSTDSLQRYLRGEVKPPVDALVLLAQASGISLEWLITGRKPGEEAARLTQEQPGTYGSAENKGLTQEDTLSIIQVISQISGFEKAPIKEQARVWTALINNQLSTRARLRAEANRMLKDGPPQAD
jgi:transcriptional regulator with XRE-family HTH domain